MLLSAYFGRLPVLLFFVSMALGTSAWCAAATSFDSYLAARILNGFFSIVAEAVSALRNPNRDCMNACPDCEFRAA